MIMRAEDLPAALRDAADSTPAPDRRAARQGVARRVRRHQTRRLLAIAAAAIVLLGVGVTIARHRDDTSEHVVTGLDQVPKLVPTYVPDGLGLSRIVDLPYVATPGVPPAPSAHSVNDIRSFLSIYATGSGDDALGGSSFGVVVTKLPAEMQAGGSDPVGSVYTATVSSGPRESSIVVAPGTIVGVLSRQLTNDELAVVARSVVLDADGIRISRIDVPAGYVMVVNNRPSGLVGPSAIVVSTAAHGYVAAWQSADPIHADSRLLFLAVTRQDQSDLDVIRWGNEDTSFVDIDGHRAVLGSLPGGTTTSSSGDGPSVTTQGPRTWVLSWLRDDHTLVTLQAIGGLTEPGCAGDCTPELLQRVARSLQPVGDRQWQTFVSATTTTPPDPNCTLLPGGNGQMCSSSDTAVAIPPVDGPNGTGG
jgi:hypothetical protein